MPLILENESELITGQSMLLNNSSANGWLLLNYVGPSTVRYVTGGELYLDMLTSLFKKDQIQYALVHINAPENGRTAFRNIFVVYIGPDVDTTEKETKAAFLEDTRKFLQPFDSEVTVLDKEKLTTETLIERTNLLSDNHVIE